MSTLPNPFLNSAVISPRTAGSAVASSDLQPRATAVPIPASTGGPQEASAPAPTKNPDADALGCLTAEDEALYWQLRHADNPFERDLPELPDVHAFFDEIEPAPLFLQRAMR